MSDAKSLGDLLRIRFANLALIERVNSNLGSAVGFKYTNGALTDEPAVIIFVPQKLHARWLAADQVIPEFLQGPDGLTCRTDVIESDPNLFELPDSLNLAFFKDKATLAPLPLRYIRQAPPLDARNIETLQALHGATDRIHPGSRLLGRDSQGNGYAGTLGCFVRDRNTQKLGALTNYHVADHMGNVLYYPTFDGVQVGVATRLHEYIPDERRFPRVNQQNAFYRVDCAYLELLPDMADMIDPHLFGIGNIGAALPLDLNTMGAVGRRVISVGSRRGVQGGTIMAYSYEYEDGDQSFYTDYLILGDERMGENGIPSLPTAFSDHGDSGKLIVTDDHHHNAVALLWGGSSAQLRPQRQMEKWSFGIDINRVLNLLDVDIHS